LNQQKISTMSAERIGNCEPWGKSPSDFNPDIK